SPNSGYPEAALAGILDCRFGGTHDYFGESVYKPYIGVTQRDFTYSDMEQATGINRGTEICAVLLAMTVRYLSLL
ncbi:MAG: cobalamin biosynthesis protein, partial [Muribaculaceae bacterium]|nr:cobalamin biosynthesis protein [Muribaculaceae bacterium]